MAPYKSPDNDGLHVGFFQETCELVGESLCNFTLEFLHIGCLPEGSNDTLLVLIPKVKHPDSIFQLRPISLCNVGYKVITKTLTNRLKEFMPSISAQNQSSFVPERQIIDNILIYQEVLHSMRTQKQGKGIMMIKVDLEKAYDWLSWDYIRNTVEHVRLLESWIRNVMHYIETVRMSIVWNGKKLDWFIPTRGIRQGDAISPYLFVLCMERLGHVISKAVGEGSWKPVKLSKHRPPLSHILFAYDLLLFVEASRDQIDVILNCLDKFCAISGHKVSLNKSSIAFSSSVDPAVASRISDTSEIPIVSKLEKYLGIPSITRGVSILDSFSIL